MTHTQRSFLWASLLLLLPAGLAACSPEYKDKNMALLLKPELLSVVAEPPVAAPGATVGVAYLLADEHGPLTAPLSLWLPVASGVNGSLPSGAALDEAFSSLPDYGLTQTDLLNPIMNFHLREGRAYTFDTTGLAAQTLTLLTATEASTLTPEAVLKDPNLLLAEIENGRIKVGLRTVQVSLAQVMNANPTVETLSVLAADGRSSPATFTTSQAAIANEGAALAALRQAAADQPVEVKSGAHVTFVSETSDDGPKADLRYQWISNGGDFGNYRLRKEPWSAPRYKDPSEFSSDQRDLRGQSAVDWRLDPNLYAVWLILRDNGHSLDSLGQTWAEFFVRIVP